VIETTGSTMSPFQGNEAVHLRWLGIIPLSNVFLLDTQLDFDFDHDFDFYTDSDSAPGARTNLPGLDSQTVQVTHF
jgi:hypothetical protein